jgi:biopolymer transport protein ExbD
MSWKIRHEGSPAAVEVETPTQVVEGLHEGLWETTDEVMGPDDAQWTPLETHPAFAEAAADVEPPPFKEHEDETHVDMTALIDVCLVLLIFIILTTIYGRLLYQKVIQQARLTAQGASGPPVMTKDQVDKFMIKVEVRMQNGKAVIKVEDRVVTREAVAAELKRYVSDTRKTELLLDYSDDVPHGLVVELQDDARLAGIQHVNVRVPEKDLPKR